MWTNKTIQLLLFPLLCSHVVVEHLSAYVNRRRSPMLHLHSPGQRNLYNICRPSSLGDLNSSIQLHTNRRHSHGTISTSHPHSVTIDIPYSSTNHTPPTHHHFPPPPAAPPLSNGSEPHFFLLLKDLNHHRRAHHQTPLAPYDLPAYESARTS